eukprot:9438917-Karenia_brevis.AAC.1
MASGKERRRWLRFIETPGIETAIWPHLFWDPKLCFTIERLQGREDQDVPTLEQRLHDPYGEFNPENVDVAGYSMKRSYMAKALGPLMDYGSSYELLHFIYDLSMWTTIGARSNLHHDVPLRLLMAGHP